MATFLTDRDSYQALIIPDGRWVSWESESTAAPDGGRFDVTSSSNLGVVPVDIGTGAPTDDYVLTCARSGQPAPADGNAPGGFTSENQTTSATYGLDECYHLTGVSTIIRPFTTQHKDVTLCTTSEERLVVAAVSQTSNAMQVWYQDNDDTNPQSTVTGPTVTAAGTTKLSAFAYGDGKARVLFSDVIPTTTNYPFRIGCATLDGATVTTDSRRAVDDMVLAQTSSTATESGKIATITDISAAARGDEVLLVVAVNYHSSTTYRSNALSTFRQYASTDGGFSFRFIGELPDIAVTDNVARPAVIATDAGFTVAFLQWSTTYSKCLMHVRNIGSAYAPLSGAQNIAASLNAGGNVPATGSVTSGVLTVPERLAAWVDHRGYQFVAVSEFSIFRSIDGGVTWGNLSPYADQNSSDTMEPWDAAFFRGQAVLSPDRTSRGVSTDESVTLLSLGGWTNDTWPEAGDGAPDEERPRWSQVYIPCGGVQRLTDVSVSATSMGQTLTLGVNRFTSGATFGVATITIDIDAGTGTDASNEPAAFEASGTTSASATAGGLTNLEYPLTYELDVTDGVGVWYGLRVTHQSGELKVHERTGPSAFTLRQTVSLTYDRVDVRILIQDGDGIVLYREQNTATEGFATPATRTWQRAPALSLNLANAWGGGAPTASRARIITRMTTGDTADLHYFAVRGEENTDYNLTGMIANTDPLRPASYGYRPLYIAPDIVVRSTGGAISQGETHTITAAYDYGLEQMTNTDPRRGFREASGSTGALELAWQTVDEVDIEPTGNVIAIALVGINFGSVTPYLHTGGSWSSVGTIDTSVGGGALQWDRKGKTVLADAAGSVQLLVREGEFNGDRWHPGTVEGSTIEHTIGGQWDDADYRPELRLDSEHTGTSGASGSIVPRTIVLLIPCAGLAVRGVKLSIAAAQRGYAGGQLEVKQAVLGRLLPHQQYYSWGRVVSLEMGATTTELRDRSSRRVVDAQPRRVVDVAWADGIDTRQASEDTDTPSAVDVFGSSYGQAGKGATAWEVYGTLQRLNGDQPVVYLPRVPWVAGNAETYKLINRRDLIVYGRLEGDARMETIVGQEYTGEVIRGLGFTIRELI